MTEKKKELLPAGKIDVLVDRVRRNAIDYEGTPGNSSFNGGALRDFEEMLFQIKAQSKVLALQSFAAHLATRYPSDKKFLVREIVEETEKRVAFLESYRPEKVEDLGTNL